jgi:hypothetical protein
MSVYHQTQWPCNVTRAYFNAAGKPSAIHVPTSAIDLLTIDVFWLQSSNDLQVLA